MATIARTSIVVLRRARPGVRHADAGNVFARLTRLTRRPVLRIVAVEVVYAAVFAMADAVAVFLGRTNPAVGRWLDGELEVVEVQATATGHDDGDVARADRDLDERDVADHAGA